MNHLSFLLLFLALNSTITESHSIDLEIERAPVRFFKPLNPLNERELKAFIDEGQRSYPNHTEVESYNKVQENLGYFLARAYAKRPFTRKHSKLSEGLAKLTCKRGRNLFRSGFLSTGALIRDIKVAKHFIERAIYLPTDPRRPDPHQRLRDYKKKLIDLSAIIPYKGTTLTRGRAAR